MERYILNNRKENSVETLEKEWNYEKNKKKLKDYSLGSGEKVWWKCENGHEWQATIKERRRGTGCPYCKGKLPIIGKTDLQSQRPDLAKEWNYEKNKGKLPNNYTLGAKALVWWKCRKGHEWQARIYSRVYGTGCPYCAGQRVIEGKNDLLSQAPEIAKEWDYEKNKNLKPNEICVNSGKKVYWKCAYGHSWKISPNSRYSQKSGCPKCSSELRTSFPEQAIYYYLSKEFDWVENRKKLNNKMEVDVFIKEKNIGVEYDGIYYHSSKEALKRELKKDELCKGLGIKLIHIKETEEEKNDENNCLYRNLNEKMSLDNVLIRLFKKIKINKFDINIARDRQEILNNYKNISNETKNEVILNEWDYEKNGNLLPQMFSNGSHTEFWWICSKGHSYKASMNCRTRKKEPTGCPYCAGKKVLKGYNDLATTDMELLKEWDYKRNTEISPEEVTHGSGKKVWWICSNGHEWQAQISKRSNGRGCPYCTGKKVLKGYNDLATTCKEIAKEWNYKKNIGISPEEVTKGSNKKVWWICSNGHEWQEVVYRRTSRMDVCPECKKLLLNKN